MLLFACSSAPETKGPNRVIPVREDKPYSTEDAYLWLEDIYGKKSIEWAESKNAPTLSRLQSDSRYAETESQVRQILLAKDRIPSPRLRGGLIYNFWQDEKNVRGLWRRTTLQSYQSANPTWETILDLDQLAKTENENWVWAGSNCLPPIQERCLLSLSRGGKDAAVVREFNTTSKKFVEDGFKLNEAKSDVSWIDQNTVFVGTDFGVGSLTSSGYPRVVKVWKRGTPLTEAKKLYEGIESDVSVGGYTEFRPEGITPLVIRFPSFFEEEVYVVDSKFVLKHLPFPNESHFVGSFKGQYFAQLRTKWKVNGKTFAQGSVVAIQKQDFKGTTAELVYEPNLRTSIGSIEITSLGIYMIVYQDVKGWLLSLTRNGSGKWLQQPLQLPQSGSILAVSTDSFDSRFLVQYESFTQPTSIYLINGPTLPSVVLKSLPPRFDGSKYEASQYFAKSVDGTEVPYFVVHSKNVKLDGQNPTLLYGYGGFEVSLTPDYDGAMGKAWLEKGGVYALANIRGGGEYGPRWHQAALKTQRQRAFDDFAAVARDLATRKISAPSKLGIMGGSNGGLLVGVALTQYPELFRAAVCQVPLLDMLRYTQLLAGASWMGEYGDPAIEAEREAILKYSPYQNLKKDADYPEVFFLTSTADDRVHPGHARKMAAKMDEMGHEHLYYENTEGGHGAAANLEQRIKRLTLEYVYLYQKLFD